MILSAAVRISFISLILLPTRAFAAPFDAARLPADASGIGHLDLDALRKTTLHRLLLPKLGKGKYLDDVTPQVRPFARAILQEAHGVSFWGEDEDSGAIVVQVPDGKRIQGLLDKVPHEEDLRVAGTLARRYHFSTDGKDGDGLSLAAVVGNLLILADDMDSLAKTIGVASGRVKSLAAARKQPGGPLEKGVFFFAALDDKLLHKIKEAAESKTLRLDMTSLTVHVGEVRAELQVRAKLVLASAEQAQQLKSMADGILALASMSDDGDELGRVVKGLRLSVSGKALNVSLSIPSAKIAEIVDLDN